VLIHKASVLLLGLVRVSKKFNASQKIISFHFQLKLLDDEALQIY